ncbi:polar amino acid transport system substrate-binding protein [Pseudomonas flavescens]|uniref:Polar amino acid transport system substrate-binding protein n=1 Tax=Phytopseudomonas flavescens TaxID=29435 RepID=A0A1G7ZL16_9GAMM|nr:ABC transporter substrate-binding protein [Pseudomonas flavescens]SDH09374.1 polar amino acid transport system substrate-binding protein [Pseudomonas flavescens]
MSTQCTLSKFRFNKTAAGLGRILRPFTSLLLAGSLAFAGTVQAQTYKVGTTTSGMPFTFLDLGSEEIQGFVPDLMQALAKEQDFTYELVPSRFDSLIPAIGAGKIQIIAAPMYITEEREKVVDFTQPIYTYGEGLLQQADDPTGYRTLDDLKGKVVGVETGTTFIEILQKRGDIKEIKTYGSSVDLMRDVALGRADVGLWDAPILAFQLQKKPNAKLKVAPNYHAQMSGSIGFSVKDGNTELLNKLNDGLDALRKDGRLDALLKKWTLE